MMTANSLSVKDMLQKGMTEKEMYDALQEQIKEAKAEIAKEAEKKANAKAKEARVAETRKAAIRACYEHMVARGFIDDDLDDADIDEICESIKDAEDSIAMYANIFYPKEDKLKPKKLRRAEDIDVDDVISNFLSKLV